MKKEVKFLYHNSTKGIIQRVFILFTSLLMLFPAFDLIPINDATTKRILGVLIIISIIIQLVFMTNWKKTVEWNRKKILFYFNIWKKPTVFKFSKITSFEIKNETLILEENYGDLTTFNVEEINYESRERILEILRINTRY